MHAISSMIHNFRRFYYSQYKHLWDEDELIVDRHVVSFIESTSCVPSGTHTRKIRAMLAFLNSGDCGLAAVCIGEQLERLGYPVTYHANGAHYFFSVHGIYYDTLRLRGVSGVKEIFHRPELFNLRSGDLTWLLEQSVMDEDSKLTRKVFKKYMKSKEQRGDALRDYQKSRYKAGTML